MIRNLNVKATVQPVKSIVVLKSSSIEMKDFMLDYMYANLHAKF